MKGLYNDVTKNLENVENEVPGHIRAAGYKSDNAMLNLGPINVLLYIYFGLIGLLFIL